MKTTFYTCDSCKKQADCDDLPFGWYAVQSDTLSTRGRIKAHICSQECLHEYFFSNGAKPIEVEAACTN